MSDTQTSEWIEWNGGDRPVPSSTEIEALTGSGRKLEGRADEYEWTHSGSRHDIIAYRVVKP